jgi:uncharacterized membrane protein
VCTAQLADYVSEAGAFCGFENSCEDVTNSEFGKPLGIPLPVIGLTGFAVLFAFTFVPTGWAVRVIRVLAVIAGGIGLVLIVIQFAVLHKLCPLCLTVDGCSILIAVLAAVGLARPAAPSRYWVLGWTALTVITLLLPVCWTALVMPPEVPAAVQAQWKPGEITLVEISDFECSHCQKADKVVREFMSTHKVRFARLVATMPGHMNSADDARAYFAAREQGKGEEMAPRILDAHPCTKAKCREIAVELGLNMEKYDEAISKGGTDKEFKETNAFLYNMKKGVPQVWIQNELLETTITLERLEKAYQKAKPAK